MYRDMHWNNEAIAVLNKFVEVNMEDSESWNELTEIYLSQQNYPKAIHCYEEILLHTPKNHHIALKYAELLYSTRRDRLDDMITARKYFMLASICRTAESIPNVRALFGIVKATKAISKL